MSSLPQGYRFVDLPKEEFQQYWKKWGDIIFKANDTSLDLQRIYSEQEKVELRKLGQNLTQLVGFNICIFKGDEFCGWFTGDQYSNDTFYMRNSAILPDHRRQGLYTALMNEVLKRTKELGFQILLSRHVTTNNSIIVAKLKAGFVISALEVSDRFGTLVHLTYLFNETRKKTMKFRSGDLKPDQTLKDAMGL